jgi:hypothetical protein
MANHCFWCPGCRGFFPELTNNPDIDLVWDRLIAAVQKQIASVDLPMDKTRQIQLRLEMAAAASKEDERNCARSALCFGAHNA